MRGIVFQRNPDTGRREVVRALRLRYLLFAFLSLGLAASPLWGKGSPTDILIQSTTDVFGELAPCG